MSRTKFVAIVVGLIALAVVNTTVYRREELLQAGRTVLLEVVPVDPRSLMQGDYMALQFALVRKAFAESRNIPRQDGRVIVTLDPSLVANFKRVDDGSALATGEIALRYRIRQGHPQFGTNGFFFQEGRGPQYAKAKYGAFRVAVDGEMILTELRDDKLQTLGTTKALLR